MMPKNDHFANRSWIGSQRKKHSFILPGEEKKEEEEKHSIAAIVFGIISAAVLVCVCGEFISEKLKVSKIIHRYIHIYSVRLFIDILL